MNGISSKICWPAAWDGRAGTWTRRKRKHGSLRLRRRRAHRELPLLEQADLMALKIIRANGIDLTTRVAMEGLDDFEAGLSRKLASVEVTPRSLDHLALARLRLRVRAGRTGAHSTTAPSTSTTGGGRAQNTSADQA